MTHLVSYACRLPVWCKVSHKRPLNCQTSSALLKKKHACPLSPSQPHPYSCSSSLHPHFLPLGCQLSRDYVLLLWSCARPWFSKWDLDTRVRLSFLTINSSYYDCVSFVYQKEQLTLLVLLHSHYMLHTHTHTHTLYTLRARETSSWRTIVTSAGDRFDWLSNPMATG